MLFDHTGLSIYPHLWRVNTEVHPAAGYGGFLYIEHFEICSDDLSEDRRNEPGTATAAIRSLLKLPGLDCFCSVAGYICEGNPFPGNRWNEGSRQRPSSDVIRQRMANDARQFLCAGFREIDENGVSGRGGCPDRLPGPVLKLATYGRRLSRTKRFRLVVLLIS